MNKPVYDLRQEEILNEVICALDENPKLCTNPIEESTYLGFSLYSGEEGFQQNIEKHYNDFIQYLNSFVAECNKADATQEVLIPVLARLFTLYRHTKNRFAHSPLRMEWKNYSKYYEIPNLKNDYRIEKQQKYTRWAYKFFYKSSSIQLYFINQLLKDVTVLIKANDIGKANLIENEKSDKENIIKEIPTTKYHFKILPSVSKQSYNILSNLHKNLKENGYIVCTLPEFRQVFMSKTPRPIIWLKPYNHLSYFIKNLTDKFLKNSAKPSNNQVALALFYDRKFGIFFKNKSIYHDGHYKKYHEILDGIIKDSISTYINI
ncbi:MAG TPA: hypothetical protein PKM76_03270 [Bacteroidales bacterium]|nr:hypothetical protein [Bacteroidales bacterium]